MKVIVTQSAVIDAPIDRVWEVLRDFNSHAQWHPAVESSEMENDLGGDVVGGVRRFRLSDGAEMREQLLSHNDREHTYSYCILDSPLPLVDYMATVQLKPVTDGDKTFWGWNSQFLAPDDRATELKDLVGRQIYEAGFTGLRTFLVEGEAPARPEAPAVKTAVIPAIDAETVPSSAVTLTEYGDPGVLTLSDVTVPPPGSQEVRIRQTAVAVNYLDIKHRKGIASGFDLPGTPGVEGVGEIIDVGAQVNGLFVGDRVAYMDPKPGSYAGIRCVAADTCIPIPESVSDVEASTLLKGITTALLLGRVCRAAPGEAILIQAVAGGMGHLLSQWARSMDLTVIGTVSTIEKARFSRDHGCDHPILVEDDRPLYDDVMRITNGRGVDCWVHSSGARRLDDALSCLSRGGQLAIIGDRDGEAISLDVSLMKQRSLTVSAPVVFDYVTDRSYLQRLAHRLFTKIQNRTIIPAIETLPLSNAADAHQKIESRQTMGAFVLIPD